MGTTDALRLGRTARNNYIGDMISRSDNAAMAVPARISLGTADLGDGFALAGGLALGAVAAAFGAPLTGAVADFWSSAITPAFLNLYLSGFFGCAG